MVKKSLLVMTTAALLGGQANGAIIAQDNFSYADGALQGNGAATGGWGEAWQASFNSGIQVSSGVVTAPTPSARVERQLDAPSKLLVDGGAEDDGTSVFIGVDWQFGAFYSGFEIKDAGTFRFQLGAQSGGPVLIGSDINDIAITSGTDEVKRYVFQIDFDDTNGDSLTLYQDGAVIGSQANAGDLSFDRLGFGIFRAGDIPHADNLVVATTFEEANIPEPGSLALLGLGGFLIARRRRGC